MGERRRVATGTIWEQRVGYSRAIEAGGMIFVAGTVAADERGEIVHPQSAYRQTEFILRKIERALTELGSSLDDVVRTRIFVVNMNDQDEVGRAHAECVGHARPACTMVAVKGLADPTALVEIEADAVRSG